MCLLLLAALSLSISTICYRLYFKFIKVPSEIQRHFRQQGVGGPTYNAISGNSNELRRLMMMAEHKSPPDESFNNDHVVRQVMPHYYFWSKVYGDQFLFWFGTRPRLAVTDPEMIKEVLLNTNGWFRKARVNPLVKALFGEGIVYLEGEQWAVHRKITSQAFNMERVKDMVPEIVASTNSLLAEIEVKIGGENRLEFDVYKEFNNLSADVISRTAFGSNFEEGKRIFEIQDQLIKIASEAMRSVYFPGFKYLPTKKNRLSWKLQRESKEMITKIIEKNDKTRENPKALLSLLMSPYKTKGNVEKRLGLNDIVDECKTIYFAGKESTANLLTWVFLLLASHQEWQNRAREEVVQVCGRDELPSAEHLANFKMISMILNEALRLYPAAPISVREACKNVKLGSLQIPANTELFLAMAAVHHDPKIWGEDANKFNPLRFIEPKKHLASYFPFGIGPRICVGQNLAIVEAKIVVAMIIRKYRFVVSPSYVHSPFQSLTVGPQYGAPMIFSKV
ncbi:cytochrome P450 734A6-like [Cynara cardunculus var. scolymus]|uniref:cytochrome P450 734A6-like n=1 Tax=Cynara cardunculus var. scolymus TaxID=59895 RepID=UPI000D6311E1|nr:cytochrome P450 734A6-like [Cynara cardunculus var. scolymus]